MTYSGASNLSATLEEELRRRRQLDSISSSTLQASLPKKTNVANDAEAIQNFLKATSSAYMQIETEKNKQKSIDAHGIARREEVANLEYEQANNTYQELLKQEAAGKDVVEELKIALEKVEFTDLKVQQIINEAKQFSRGKDSLILDHARIERYFSTDGGGADLDYQQYLKREEAKRIKNGDPLPTSTERRALLETFVNSVIAERWGDADENYLKVNIYPASNSWQEKKDNQEIAVSNAAYGFEERQNVMVSMTTSDFNINNALYRIANSTGTDGKGVFGYEAAQTELITMVTKLSQSGIKLDIEEWGKVELNSGPFKGRLFNEHPTYDRLIDEKRIQLKRFNDRADEAADFSAKESATEILEGIEEMVENNQIPSVEFVRDVYDKWELENPDANPQTSSNFLTSLRNFTISPEAIAAKDDAAMTELRANELTEEDIGKLHPAIRGKYQQLLEKFGSRDFHKDNYTSLTQTVTGAINKEMAPRAELKGKSALIVYELEDMYYTLYMNKVIADVLPSVARKQALDETITFFKINGGDRSAFLAENDRRRKAGEPPLRGRYEVSGNKFHKYGKNTPDTLSNALGIALDREAFMTDEVTPFPPLSKLNLALKDGSIFPDDGFNTTDRYNRWVEDYNLGAGGLGGRINSDLKLLHGTFVENGFRINGAVPTPREFLQYLIDRESEESKKKIRPLEDEKIPITLNNFKNILTKQQINLLYGAS